ncbi:hypothetical protein LHK82_26675, partial [Escherichia coli]|nr:hypothetical protein [Escherichia coli]
QSIHILRGVRQQQDEPGRFSICSRQAAVVQRADRTLEPVIQRELEIRKARLIQEREHALSLERERQPEIQERTLDGPSLGW